MKWAPIRPFASSPAVGLACVPSENRTQTHNNRVRWFSLVRGAVAEIWRIGNLVMPFFRLDAESNNFSHVKVKGRSVFVLPDPDLIRVVTMSGQRCRLRDLTHRGLAYNLAPSKRRFGGTRISLKNSTPTAQSK